MVFLAFISLVVSGDDYYTNLWTSGLMFAGMASAWNIISGFGGQFSLGHAVFFGVGGYTAILVPTHGGNLYVGMLCGVLLAGFVAAALAVPLFRLRGHFFTIATLGLSIVALALANYFDFLGAAQGIALPFEATLLSNPADYVWVMLGYLALVSAVALYIKHTRLGFSLFAVRDDQEAARSIGINPLLVKSIGLVLSAMLTGLAGALFIHFIGFLDPESAFSIERVGIQLPLLALIGGIGTVIGPIVGALILQTGTDYLRGEFGGEVPGLNYIILAVILITFARFFPGGMTGLATSMRRHLTRKKAHRDR